MTPMDDGDRPAEAQPESGEGATRSEFLRGALGAGAVIGAGGLLAACGGGGSSGTSSGAGTAASTGSPAAGRLGQGGSLRIGLATGSSADSLSPWVSFSNGDAARQFAMYDSLTQIRGSKEKLEPTNMLIEELTPNKDGSVWTIRLKSDVEFHNGKTLDVDDFIFTTNMITNPKTGAFNIGRFILFDVKNAKKLDKLTLEASARHARGDHARAPRRRQRREHRPRGIRPQEAGGDRALQAQELHPGPRDRVRALRELLGRQGEGSTSCTSSPSRTRRRASTPCSPVRSTCWTRCRSPSSTRSRRTRTSTFPAFRPATSSRSRCASISRRSTTSACARRCASRSIASR